MARLMDDPAEIDRILARGAERAREIAAPILAAPTTSSRAPGDWPRDAAGELKMVNDRLDVPALIAIAG
jgi:hypothetical protein